jgi:protein-S-isoprenylcysteine O-methyltransferase Ste14
MTWGYFFAGLWLAWLVYWLISAAGNKATARRESPQSQFSYKVPLYLGTLFLIHQHWWTGWFTERVLHPSAVFIPLGALPLVLGLGFTVWARVHLGTNWSAIVTLKKNHELIRTGPYGWVRHPIYSGLTLAFLGTALALGEWRGFIGFALITYSFVVKLRIEEKWMNEVFGESYARYKAEVPALFPGIY